jgi:hypothetical protein
MDKIIEEPEFNDDVIKKLTIDENLQKIIMERFFRIKRKSAKIIIENVLKHRTLNRISLMFSKTTYNDNIGKFDNEEITPEFRFILKKAIMDYKETIEEELTQDEKDDFVLNKKLTYERFQYEVSEKIENNDFIYNFDEPDLELATPQNNNMLQRCKMQITSNAQKFDYPIIFKYRCSECSIEFTKKTHNVRSTKNKINCRNFINNPLTNKPKICGTILYPNEQESTVTTCYFYQLNYKDCKGAVQSGTGISFKLLPRGENDCALFKCNNPLGKEVFHIVDFRVEKTEEVIFPEQTDENYLITLQKFFDARIKEKTGKEIWGLYPIKIALIIQAIIQRVGYDLNANIQLVGRPSSGKSLVLENYGYLLYGPLFKKTKARSVSIPELQGTRNKFYLFNKELHNVSTGLLGEYYNIYIDEVGQNKELVENLKLYLADKDYEYNKAGSDGVKHNRTSHVNTAGNVDEKHMGVYVGGIKKAYKEYTDTIGKESKQPWDGTLNLFLPLLKYTDLYYHDIIKNKRDEFTQQHKFWMDGYDDALHERFLFYFNIDNKIVNEELNTIVDTNCNVITNFSLEKLYSQSIEEYFNSLKDYAILRDDSSKFKEIDKFFSLLELDSKDARIKTFWNIVLKISRIANKRIEINNDDYKLVYWLIEATNRMLDITETNKYELSSLDELRKNTEKEATMQKKIEDEKIKEENKFGLSEEEKKEMGY